MLNNSLDLQGHAKEHTSSPSGITYRTRHRQIQTGHRRNRSDTYHILSYVQRGDVGPLAAINVRRIPGSWYGQLLFYLTAPKSQRCTYRLPHLSRPKQNALQHGHRRFGTLWRKQRALFWALHQRGPTRKVSNLRCQPNGSYRCCLSDTEGWTWQSLKQVTWSRPRYHLWVCHLREGKWNCWWFCEHWHFLTANKAWYVLTSLFLLTMWHWRSTRKRKETERCLQLYPLNPDQHSRSEKSVMMKKTGMYQKLGANCSTWLSMRTDKYDFMKALISHKQWDWYIYSWRLLGITQNKNSI